MSHIQEIEKLLAERESKMYHYYKAVFEDGFDGGYPMSNDDDIKSFHLKYLTKKRKELEGELQQTEYPMNGIVVKSSRDEIYNLAKQEEIDKYDKEIKNI